MVCETADYQGNSMSRASASTARFVLLNPETPEAAELTKILGQLGEVVVLPDEEAVRAALERQRADWVVATPGGFHACVCSETNSQLSAILDSIGQGVCILDTAGQLMWANTKLREFPPEAETRLRQYCRETYYGAEEAASPRSRSLSLVTVNKKYFEVSITPITDQYKSILRLVAVVTDVTRSRRLQQKIDAIDNAGRELVRVDVDKLSKMDVPQRLELLEQKIIHFTRELLHFDNFAIRLLDKTTDKLELVWSMGLPPEAQELDIYASPENSGISGYVAVTGRSYICSDIRKDSRYLIGIHEAKSSLTVALRLHDQVIGIFNIESDRPAAFSEDDRQFAEIFGRYVAIALHILDLLVVERHATTGQLASNVSAEIAGPLGNILVDATTLMEDYIGHDDLRFRLQQIADNVVKIREVVKEVAQPGRGILGSQPETPKKDPLLANKKVLVIDDEENIRETVRDILAKYGCVIDIARDGTEATALINNNTYHLVISDIRMPGCDGYRVFQVVKQRDAHCPVIFMTGFGYDPGHSIIRAGTEGLAAVLYKPFKVDQLLDDVRGAIAASADH